MDKYQIKQFMIMKRNIWLFCLSVCALCACKEKEIRFVPLTQFDYVNKSFDNGKQIVDKRLNFIIVDYSDNKKTTLLIDSFALKTAGDDFKNYTNYSLTFYKYSNITNIEHLKANPRDIDRYSQDNDMIFDYNWSDGKFLLRKKIKNGRVVEPKH